ncbi:class I SAM-dependent methyltransferase [Nocardia niigatensis]|uniref:class I SAM-dependent methyltransferase n=1 Tax=Nocardia niigatensis TaxID=209249 RepID=UPI0003193772|nr:methyltransferase domain-containing protein [Nocardia niigatensis]
MKARLEQAATERAARIADRIAPYLPVTGRVLDVGSGTGHIADLLCKVTGLAVVETDVVDMHVVGPGPVLCADGVLPFPGDDFDTALVLHVLQFPADPAAVLAETARVASRVIVLQSTSGGRLGRASLVVRGFFLGRLAFQLSRLVGFVDSGMAAGVALHVRRVLSRDDVRAAARAAGLREVAFEPDRWPVPFGGRDLFVFDRAR